MDQPRSYRFYTKRSEHYNNLEKQEAELHKKNTSTNCESKLDPGKPLKDNTNIQRSEESESIPSTSLSAKINCSPNKQSQLNIVSNSKERRPLKCLETLAQKAGILLDEKVDTINKLEKPQSPAQGGSAQQQQLPLQISHEQLQQLQQLQFQQPFGTIQVKQEYPNQQSNATHMNDVKTQLLDVSHQQMQVLEGQAQGQHQVPTSISLNQQGTTTINTLSPLQTMSGQEWQNRVQVLPQTIQNTPYLQQLYTGQPVVMTGIPGLAGQQQIQLIAASGKTFQGSPMGTQQMITTNSQGKQVIGSTGAFSSTYTLPTIPSSQSQTLVLSPFNMIPNQQGQNVIPSINTTQNNTKQINTQEQMQKQLVTSQKLIKNSQQNNVNQNTPQGQHCVQVPSAIQTTQLLSPLQQTNTHNMQFTTPWIQGTCQMPFWTANGLQSQIIPPNSILIRGTNPDGTQGMFIQQAQNPQQTVQPQTQNQTITQLQCGISQQNQQKSVRNITESGAKHLTRTPLLPQGSSQSIRPASSVSTQTAQNSGILTPKTGKVRTSKQTVRPSVPIMKQDLSQAKIGHNSQIQQVVTSAGNKMVVMSTGIGINTSSLAQIQSNNNTQIINAEKQQQQQIQMHYQQQQYNKNHQALLQQHQQQQQQQQQAMQQQFALQIQNQTPQQVSQTNIGQFQLNTSQSQPLVQNTFIQGQAQSQTQGLVLQGQQMLIQNQNGQPTITMTPNHLISHQVASSNMSQQMNIQPKPVSSSPATTAQFEKLPISSTSSSSNIMNSLSQGINSAQQNLIGQVNSPQNPIQPPQNPLIAMTNLSTSPLTLNSTNLQVHKESDEKRNSSSASVPSQNIQNTKNTVVNGETCSTTLNLSSSSHVSSPSKRSFTPQKPSEEKSESLSAIIGSSESFELESAENRSIVSTTTPVTPVSQSNITTTKTENSLSPLISTSAHSITTLNGLSPVGVSVSSKNEKDLPKAMVKPSVLTHVIEGFVIQESQEPFPVNRQRYSDRDEQDDEPPKKKPLIDPVSESSHNADKLACANCGKLELKTKLKRKRYCSINCSKLVKSEENNDCSVEENKNMSSSLESCKSSENITNNEESQLKTDTNNPIGKWTAKEVCKFIAEVLGTDEYNEDFTTQEIDGSALILLKEKHLVNAMGMKLGPALKIVAKVQTLLSLDTEISPQQNSSTAPSQQ